MTFLNRSLFFLRLIFVVAIALVFFLSALSYKHLENLNQSNEMVNHSFDVSLKLEELHAHLKGIETERRNYILTGDRHHRALIPPMDKTIRRVVGELSLLLYKDPTQQHNMMALQSEVARKLQIVGETYQRDDITYTQQELIYSLTQGNQVMDQISKRIDSMLVREKDLLERRRSELLFSQKNTPVYLYIISLFSLSLLAFSFYRINRDVKQQKLINRELQLSLDTLNLSETVGEYGIWTFMPESGVYTFSDNIYRLLGLEPQSFPATVEHYMEHVHPEDQKRFKDNFHLMGTKDTGPFKFRVIRRDGQQRHFQATGKYVSTLTGDQVLLGIITDVSHDIENRLKLEGINWVLTERNKNLSISNQTFGEAEKIGNFGIWHWFSKDDRFVFSDNFIRLFGYDPKRFEHRLKNFMPAIHPDDRSLVISQLQRMRKGESEEGFILRVDRHDDQQLRYLSVSSRKIDDAANGQYYLVIAQDITEEYLDKQLIEEKNIILEANNKELSAFNYAASHDLQEPLRKIETFLSRLKDKDYTKLSESGQQYMDRTLLAAGRMRALIEDLLQFSRSTRSEEIFEKVNLNRVLQQVQEEQAHSIEEKNARIVSEKLPTVRAVPFQMHQLFANLIGNSLKYSKKDLAPEITITVSRVSSEEVPQLKRSGKRQYYKIVFQDNGIGFENQYADKIFTLFSRLHGRSDYEGTGIGLAICKKIMDNHNGCIYARGEEGKGATFTVLIPA